MGPPVLASLAVAVLAVVCVASLPAAALRRLEQTPDVDVGATITLTGTAIVVSINSPDIAEDKLLALRIDNRNLLVRGVGKDVLHDINSGQVISVTGDVEEVNEEVDEEGNGNGDGKRRKGRKVKTIRARKVKHLTAKKPGPKEMPVATPKEDEAIAPEEPQQRRQLKQINFASMPAAGWTTLPNVNPELSVLFIPIVAVEPGTNSLCPGTGLPQATTTQLRQAMFEAANPLPNITVGSTFSQCSLNSSYIREPTSKVLDPVRLPCSGISWDEPWNLNATCEFSDFNGAADAAEAVLAARGFNLNAYFYKVFLFPPGPCNFVGIGYVGCDGSFGCRSWIGPQFWTTPQVITHELGHNLFLGHAGSVVAGVFDQYRDDSCMMGYCCTDRCPNGPHSWQLGWHSALQLNGNNLLSGRTLNFSMGSQEFNRNAVVRIIPTWAPSLQPYFISYRLKNAGSRGMADAMHSKVHVYQASIQGQQDPSATTLRASITVNGVYRDTPAGLVIRRHWSNRNGISIISICRIRGPETMASCIAGHDYNCDNLAGEDDPACADYWDVMGK